MSATTLCLRFGFRRNLISCIYSYIETTRPGTAINVLVGSNTMDLMLPHANTPTNLIV